MVQHEDADISKDFLKLSTLSPKSPRPSSPSRASGSVDAISAVIGTLASSRASKNAVHILNTAHQLSRLSDRSLQHKADIAIQGGIGEVIAAMQELQTDVDMQREGCYILVSLSMGADIKQQIAKDGGVQAIIAGMRTHRHDSKVQEYGCCALAKLSYSCDCNQVGGAHPWGKAGERGGNADVGEGVRCGVQASSAVSMNADVAQEGSSRPDLGGVEAVAQAMHDHLEEVDVQDYGCNALGNAAFNHEANAQRLAAAGCVELVMAAMKKWRRSASVQHYACWALIAMCMHSTHNQGLIAGAGTIEAIIQSMEMHLGVAAVQQYGSWVLGQLAKGSQSIQLRIATRDGVEVLVAAMTAHAQDSPEVQFYAMWALLQLAESNHENQALMAGASVAGPVVHAMKTFPEWGGIQSRGAKLLAILVIDSSSAQQVQAAGGVDAVLVAMHQREREAEVQAAGCEMLASQGGAEEQFERHIVRQGGAGFVAAALRAHPTNPEVQHAGLKAMTCLVATEEGVETLLRMVPNIIAAMEGSVQHGGVQKYGAVVLGQLAQGSRRAQMEIAESGGLKVLVTALMECGESEGVAQERHSPPPVSAMCPPV
ncbi:hypothetical protein CYMTET_40070 [Cymbomonas tetramitiformis]|uniref:Uncharacterized protein n=1 Tax=Cymbomonas tetramitiformis TaxID=36881 RepID=A0AAE0F410_9CHLO|nr:hypothetical protein CYMTET_40070 [Cymbomonas tetramitiformis]